MTWDKRTGYGMAALAAVCIAIWLGFALRTASGPTLAPLPPAASGAVEIPAGGSDTATTATPPENSPGSAASAPPKTIVVHVTGAVKRPGVYTLKSGDRIYHAVRAAGGFKPNAQEDALNQSDYVQDAMQIHFVTREEYARRQGAGKKNTASAPERPLIVRSRRPAPADYTAYAAAAASFAPPKTVTVGSPVPLRTPAPVNPVVVSAPVAPPSEPPRGIVLGKEPPPVADATPPPLSPEGDVSASDTDMEPTVPARSSGSARASRSSGSSGSAKFKNPGDGTVNINTAGAAELQKLPGVGPAMAARIMEHRQQKGPFRDVSQLTDVRGIGSKTLAKMRPFIRLE
jgi:comEA protein